MAGKQLFLVILSLIGSSLQSVQDNKVDSKDSSPLADVAKEILKEQNLENIGGMVNSFLQSGGGKDLVNGVLQNLVSGENAGQLLESLGGLLAPDANGESKNKPKAKRKNKKENGDINPMDLLSGLGSIVGALQGAGGEGGGEANPAALLQGIGSLLGAGNAQGGGNNAAALLQGLGSLLGNAAQQKGRKDAENNGGGELLQGLGSIIGAAMNNQAGAGGDNNAGSILQGLGSLMGGGQGGQGGINAEMIGNMISMFANSQDAEEEKPVKRAARQAPSEKAKTKKTSDIKSKEGKNKGLEGIISLANLFMNKDGGKGIDLKNVDLDLIIDNYPLILKMARSLGGPEAKKFLDLIEGIIVRNKERFSRIFKAFKLLVAKSNSQDDSFDLSGILDIASTFLSQGGNGNNQKSGEFNFADYIPMIMNTYNAFTGPEAQERANSHAEHSWSLPPVLEKVHVYYDNFVNSDMGKYLQSFIDDQPAFKIFKDEKGNFNYDKFEELIENHSFRRHWIQQLAEKLVNLLQQISDKKVYNQYFAMGIKFTNSFLEKSGFPKKAFIDTKNPAKSITNFANYAAKKYLDSSVDVKEYVEPLVIYITDLLEMAKESITPGPQLKELTDKLTNTINMEIIEPITRVNRAYRFAKTQPECDRYVFCLVNQEATNYSESLPGLKKGLYKGSSLIAAWFLTSSTGTSYWDLYTIVTQNRNCKNYHLDVCNGFHEEEIKATTEYVHSEL